MNLETIKETVTEYITTYGLQVVAAIVIFVVGRWAAKIISNIIGRIMTKSKVDQTLVDFAENFSYVALMVAVVIAALDKLGVDTASFAVIIGAAGLAIAFALKGTLGNFASGIMLIVFKPFKCGDFIKVAGQAGAVQSIQMFNTILHSPDNVKIIVPNSQVTDGNIVNYTANNARRIDLTIGVSYGDDLKKTKQILNTILTEEKRVLAEPASTVAVAELADSSVNFVVRPWVKTADYWDVKFALTEKIKNTLDENQISIPFPQRDIHMIKQD